MGGERILCSSPPRTQLSYSSGVPTHATHAHGSLHPVLSLGWREPQKPKLEEGNSRETMVAVAAEVITVVPSRDYSPISVNLFSHSACAYNVGCHAGDAAVHPGQKDLFVCFSHSPACNLVTPCPLLHWSFKFSFPIAEGNGTIDGLLATASAVPSDAT